MSNKQQKRLLPLLFLLSFFFWGCKTLSTFDSSDFTPEAPYHIEEEISFPEMEEPTKYVFLRLYNPDYNNPFYIANLLQGGINLVEVTDLNLSHSAVNFSLSDDFYGLTSGGYYQLAQESCLNPEENKYMKHASAITSEQITLALKVPESEYYQLQKDVIEYSQSHKVKYRASKTFSNAFFALKRRLFTKKENRQFGKMKYPKSSIQNKKFEDPEYVENNFICSTFIGYILSKDITSIKNYFEENKINYRLLTVTDLFYLPDLQVLFYSTWQNYDLAAEAFVEEHPEFKPYLNN